MEKQLKTVLSGVILTCMLGIFFSSTSYFIGSSDTLIIMGSVIISKQILDV